ncbi:hypothetical protein D3C71_1785980 [compost metagenome]
MGMIVAHYVPDGLRRLPVSLVRRVAGIIHGVQNAALYGLQPVAHVGDGPVLNDIFGIPPKAVADDFLQKRRQKLFG